MLEVAINSSRDKATNNINEKSKISNDKSCFESLRQKWSEHNNENENVNFSSLEFHTRQKMFIKMKQKNLEKIKKETSNIGKPEIDIISDILASKSESFDKRQENNIQRRK